MRYKSTMIHKNLMRFYMKLSEEEKLIAGRFVFERERKKNRGFIFFISHLFLIFSVFFLLFTFVVHHFSLLTHMQIQNTIWIHLMDEKANKWRILFVYWLIKNDTTTCRCFPKNQQNFFSCSKRVELEGLHTVPCPMH